MSASMIQDQLDDIFDVPKNGSNIKDESDDNQEGSYAEVAASHDNATFEQKAKEVNDKLTKDAPPADVQYTAKPEVTANAQQSIVQQSEPIKQPAKEANFEEILSKSIPVKASSQEAVPVLVQKQAFDTEDAKPSKKDEDDDEVRAEPSAISESGCIIYDQKPNTDGWLLTAPAPMYIRFYEEKGALIRHITQNGRPLDIDKLTVELKNSSVSTNVELTDLYGMAEKLTRIQDYLDRVVQIKIQATSQCSASKRGVELLRGVLAKVSYEKPAARQDGVIYDHMRDIEMYSSRIESLEQSAKDVYHNLLEAKEILSRKISIAIELLGQQNKIEGLEKTYNNLPDNVKKAVQSVSTTSRLAAEGYDRLEVQELIQSPKPKPDKTIKKSGQSDWMD